MGDVYRQSKAGISYVARPSAGAGERGSVVFLHGIGSNASSFAGVFDRLPAELDLLAWNAPGYGNSAPLDATWPLAEDYAERLAAWLDDLGKASVHLVGHSLGTLIGVAFARRFPERVASLLLASCANGYGVARGSALTEKTAARLADLARLGPREFARTRAANLIHDPGQNLDLVARVEVVMAQIKPEGYGQAVRMLASGDLPRALANVPKCPTFVIGAEDRVTPMAQTRAAAEAWERAQGAAPKVVEIAQAGHAVYLQAEAAFCDAVTDHLKRAKAPARQTR